MLGLVKPRRSPGRVFPTMVQKAISPLKQTIKIKGSPGTQNK